MAGYLVSDTRKVTTHRFMEMKQKGEKISIVPVSVRWWFAICPSARIR